MIRLPILLAALLAAGCAYREPPQRVILTQEVKVPVPVSCVPADLPRAPTYTDTDEAMLAAPDAAERYRLALLGRVERGVRLGIVEAVVDGCRE